MGSGMCIMSSQGANPIGVALRSSKAKENPGDPKWFVAQAVLCILPCTYTGGRNPPYNYVIKYIALLVFIQTQGLVLM